MSEWNLSHIIQEHPYSLLKKTPKHSENVSIKNEYHIAYGVKLPEKKFPLISQNYSVFKAYWSTELNKEA